MKNSKSLENIKNLIGKLAIRTKPVLLGKSFYGHNNYDYSYTGSPIRILKVTEYHILFDHKGTFEENLFKEPGILDKRWIDGNWISYDELMEVK